MGNLLPVSITEELLNFLKTTGLSNPTLKHLEWLDMVAIHNPRKELEWLVSKQGDTYLATCHFGFEIIGRGTGPTMTAAMVEAYGPR